MLYEIDDLLHETLQTMSPMQSLRLKPTGRHVIRLRFEHLNVSNIYIMAKNVYRI